LFVVFNSREERNQAEMLAQMLDRSDEERAPISRRPEPPPEAAEAMRELKARSYRDWCDRALPALGGKTPRQAAKARSRKLRDDVELVLREIERGESTLHPSERFDVAQLREELGLASA
jgi:hypothetical protein